MIKQCAHVAQIHVIPIQPMLYRQSPWNRTAGATKSLFSKTSR